MPPPSPLVALGIVSGSTYHERRTALRSTWLRSPECTLGEVLARFIVARPLDNTNLTAALERESSTENDLMLLETGISGRVWSPLHTMFRWFQFATQNKPFRLAGYIGKMDDDVYCNVGELTRHLRHMQMVPRMSQNASVYYGVFYWTSYDQGKYQHTGSSYTMLGAQIASRRCIKEHTCEGSFPFTTGAMQLLSRTLANSFSSSPAAIRHIERSRMLVHRPRKSPAFEDVWMGYALYALLPTVANITMVSLDRFNFYFDAAVRPTMKNTTFLVHLATNKLGERIEAAHNFSVRQHCVSRSVPHCHRFKVPSCRDRTVNGDCMNRTRYYLHKYGSACQHTPDPSVCPRGPAYPILVGRYAKMKRKDRSSAH